MGDRRQPDSPAIEVVRNFFAGLFDTPVGPDDDFFALGGDSLAGESLLASIEQEFGVSLPLSILLELPTPRGLAGAIEAKKKAAEPALLFTVRDEGSRTPLFCIHGANGTGGFSRKLREILPDQPIYAIRSLGLLPGEVPLASVPDMARSYVREIRAVRPSGPYQLFGQCQTAVVAYEVAQQLSAAGEAVEALILADPVRSKRRSAIRRFYYALIGRGAQRLARRSPQMTGKERVQNILAPAFLAAQKTYQPRAYSGRVLVVAASRNVDEVLHPRRGYPALVSELETVVIEGGHLEVFSGMDPAAPGELARAILSFLAPRG